MLKGQEQFDEFMAGNYDDNRKEAFTEAAKVVQSLLDDIDSLVEQLSTSNKVVLESGLNNILAIIKELNRKIDQLEITTELGSVIKSFFQDLANSFGDYFSNVLDNIEGNAQTINKEQILDLLKSSAVNGFLIWDKVNAGDKEQAIKSNNEAIETTSLFIGELDALKLQTPEAQKILATFKAIFNRDESDENYQNYRR